jgi:hypothetical protein
MGFTMPACREPEWVRLEHVVQEEGAKLVGFNATYRIRVLVALHIASALAALHERRHYMIDLKPLNLTVHRFSGAVGVMDCDGMSILGPDGRRYPAGLITPGFVSPENIGRRAQDIAADDRQDAFSLAIMIFLLLNRGRHPFSRIHRSPHIILPGAANDVVKGGYYPYGLSPHSQVGPAAGSIHEFLPHAVREMFDRAFRGRIDARPPAREWVDQLQHALSSFKTCRLNASHGTLTDECGFCAVEKPLAVKRTAAQVATVRIPAVAMPASRILQTVAAQAIVLGLLVVAVRFAAYLFNGGFSNVIQTGLHIFPNPGPLIGLLFIWIIVPLMIVWGLACVAAALAIVATDLAAITVLGALAADLLIDLWRAVPRYGNPLNPIGPLLGRFGTRHAGMMAKIGSWVRKYRRQFFLAVAGLIALAAKNKTPDIIAFRDSATRLNAYLSAYNSASRSAPGRRCETIALALQDLTPDDKSRADSRRKWREAIYDGENCRTDLSKSDRRFEAFDRAVASAQAREDTPLIELIANEYLNLTEFDRTRKRFEEDSFAKKAAQYAERVTGSADRLKSYVSASGSLSGLPEGARCEQIALALKKLLPEDRVLNSKNQAAKAAIADGDNCVAKTAESDSHMRTIKETVTAAETSADPGSIQAAADAYDKLSSFDNTRKHSQQEEQLLAKARQFRAEAGRGYARLDGYTSAVAALNGLTSGERCEELKRLLTQISPEDRTWSSRKSEWRAAVGEGENCLNSLAESDGRIKAVEEAARAVNRYPWTVQAAADAYVKLNAFDRTRRQYDQFRRQAQSMLDPLIRSIVLSHLTFNDGTRQNGACTAVSFTNPDGRDEYTFNLYLRIYQVSTGACSRYAQNIAHVSEVKWKHLSESIEIDCGSRAARCRGYQGTPYTFYYVELRCMNQYPNCVHDWSQIRPIWIDRLRQ